MYAFLTLLLSLSLSGGVLILALLLLRPLLRGRFSQAWQYYIWLLVILRLLLPVTAGVNLMGDLLPRAQEVLTAPVEPAEPVEPVADGGAYTSASTDPDEAGGLTIYPPGYVDPTPSPPAWNVPLLLFILWAGVALGRFLYKLFAYGRFAARLRAGWTPVTDPVLLAQLDAAKAERGITRKVGLYVDPRVSSPLLLGGLRPCIVLPSAAGPEGDLRFVLLHELVHLKRHDLAYKWLLQVTLCLHWFNPLVWRMVREADRACELACDEAVLRPLDAQERRAYGDTLLRALPPFQPNPAGAVLLSESGERLKERLGNILRYQPRKTWSAAALLLTLCVVGGGVVLGACGPSPAEEDLSMWEYNYPSNCFLAYPSDEGGPYLFWVSINSPDPHSSTESMTFWDAETQADVSLPVHFTRLAQKVQRDPAAMEALHERLTEIYRDLKNSQFQNFVVIRAEDVGKVGANKLVQQLYEEDYSFYINELLPLLTEEEKQGWLERTYANGDKLMFFDVLDSLSPTDAEIDALAQRLFDDNKVEYFYQLTRWMDREMIFQWMERAQNEERPALYGVLDLAANHKHQ